MIKYIVLIVLLCTPGIYAMDDDNGFSSAQESDTDTDAASITDSLDYPDYSDSPGASDGEGW